MLLLAGLGAWLLAAAALRPVDRMRAPAADLQTRDAAIGLAVPGTRDELARLAVTLNELLTRLHAAVEHDRAFVADAGHELRTPLTVLKGELELAARPGRSTQELMATVAAAEEIDRLIRLAEDPADPGAATNPQPATISGSTSPRPCTPRWPRPGPRPPRTGRAWAPTSPLDVDGDPRPDPAGHRQPADHVLRVSPPGRTITVTVGQDAEATSDQRPAP